jgi:hypothetical protein
MTRLTISHFDNMPKIPERILSIIDELIDQYQEDDRYCCMLLVATPRKKNAKK